jgi:hypothetical protein
MDQKTSTDGNCATGYTMSNDGLYAIGYTLPNDGNYALGYTMSKPHRTWLTRLSIRIRIPILMWKFRRMNKFLERNPPED